MTTLDDLLDNIDRGHYCEVCAVRGECMMLTLRRYTTLCEVALERQHNVMAPERWAQRNRRIVLAEAAA